MSITRRGFLQGIIGAATGALILPPNLEENAEAARRYWALDQTMLSNPEPGVWMSGRFDAAGAWRIIPVGANAYWTDGRITHHPIKVLPDHLWRVDVPREAFHTADDAFSLSVKYVKQPSPDGSTMTTHTLTYGGWFD